MEVLMEGSSNGVLSPLRLGFLINPFISSIQCSLNLEATCSHQSMGFTSDRERQRDLNDLKEKMTSCSVLYIKIYFKGILRNLIII
jgi:hypothetical protein